MVSSQKHKMGELRETERHMEKTGRKMVKLKTDRESQQKGPGFSENLVYVLLSFYELQLKHFVYLISFDGVGMQCER